MPKLTPLIKLVDPQIIPIYDVFSQDDRGHRESDVGYFTKEADARAASKDAGWYGGDATVKACHAYVSPTTGRAYLLASVKPIDLDNKEKVRIFDLRRTARAKLTDAEYDALLGDKTP